MDHLHRIDPALEKALPNGVSVQGLLGGGFGEGQYTITCIRTPPGAGSLRGLHVHDYEQIFYLVAGSMNCEIDGETFVAGPESVIHFPKGVPHRNWNEGPAETVHLSIQVGDQSTVATAVSR